MKVYNFPAAAGLDGDVAGRGWKVLLEVKQAPCSSRFLGPQPKLSAPGCPTDKLWNPI